MGFAGARATLKGRPLSSTVIVVRSGRASTVTKIRRGFTESICEECLPYFAMFDISSSRQTCIAKVLGSDSAKSVAIDSIHLAADGISEMAPSKTRCQQF